MKDHSAFNTDSSVQKEKESMQIALQLLQITLEELDRKFSTLRKHYLKNPDKYRVIYKAAKELRDNLKRNLAMYTQQKIDLLTFTGLNHLHINQAQPILENKVRGWGRKFFGSLRNAVNRFFSFIGLVKRSLENELVDFKGKVKELKGLLQNPNQEKLASYLVQINPDNTEVLGICHRADPNSIKEVMPATVIELIDKGIITPTEAIQAFPNNEEIIEKAVKESGFSALTEQEVVKLIENDKLSPFVATKNYPKQLAIVEAAYKKDPASIKNASKEAINQLARDPIKIEDVIKVFSVKVPSPEEIKQMDEQLKEALKNRDWTKIEEICDKFWFEKPKNANHQNLVELWAKYGIWDQIHDFESMTKEDDYELTYGPLNKSPETYQLEALFRKMMQEGNFKIETINHEDYFVFADGTRFNWTQIREKANWQHIDLGEADFDYYSGYMASVNKAYCTLNKNNVDTYLNKLYEGQPIPSSPINYQQMQAVNIYSGGDFYKSMNGLMRDETAKFNFRKEESAKVRDALVHSVMCASALRMLPTTEIKESYRKASTGTTEEQLKKVQAAAKKGVIELDGFVSSSAYSNYLSAEDFPSKGIHYTLKNLRGLYIAPISQVPDEQEFLIPPTQIQITSYKYETSERNHQLQDAEQKHQIEGTLVAEIGMQKKDESLALSAANPEVVIALINKGSIPAERGIKAFPQNMAVVLAAYHKDPLLIREANAYTLYTELPNLVKENKIKLMDIIKAFPENEDILSLAYKLDPSLGTPPSPKAESFAILDAKLFKIKNIYIKEGALSENYIQELSKAIARDASDFSKGTKKADYVVARIANNKELCDAFGIESTKSKENKASDIKEILYKAFNDKPGVVNVPQHR